MHRVGYLYEELIDRDNIRKAVMRSSKGKRDRPYVKAYIDNMENTVDSIIKILEEGYNPSKPNVFTMYDSHRSKIRVISCPRYFPDQIIHHAVMQVVIPIFMKGMYDHSYGSIPKRGTHKAMKRATKWLRDDPKNTKYCLVLDFKKYYRSINHAELIRMLRQKIKDVKVLYVLMAIITHYDEGVYGQSIPIGFYTSQWFANFYLQGLDHYIKEDLHVKYYVRYVDNLWLFGSNKKILHSIRRKIFDYAAVIGLEFNDNWQVFRVDSRKIDFLGYKIARDSIELSDANYVRITRQIRGVMKKQLPKEKDLATLNSYKGIIKHTNCQNLKDEIAQDIVKMKRRLKGGEACG